MDCSLCSALKEDFRLILEDDFSFCIVCKFPLKEGHLLVLPKRHVNDFLSLNENESKSLLDMTEKIKRASSKVFKEDAIYFQNTGNHSTEQHLHLHGLPSKGNLRKLISTFEGVPERQDISDKEKKIVRDLLKKEIDN